MVNEVVALLEKIKSTPLDEIPLQDAEAVNREVFDRESEELSVPVARFGSVI